MILPTRYICSISHAIFFKLYQLFLSEKMLKLNCLSVASFLIENGLRTIRNVLK